MEDAKPIPRAEQLAQAMLEQLELMNENMAKSAARQEAIGGMMDELIDWFNVIDKTMEIMTENNKDGRKLSLADFSKAWEMAAEEIFEEEDEHGEEDPLVGVDRH